MPQFEHGLYEPGEDVRVFDGSEEEDEVENSRLPLLIVLALLVLAMFGGFVWLAYNEGVARGRSENPLLASEGASKTANAGSAQAYKGFKIYEQPAPPDDDASVTTPAPAPEKTAAEKPAPVEAPKPAAKTVAPAAPKTTAMAAKPAAETKAAAQTKPAPKPAPKAASALAPSIASAPPASAYVLQIGAYKSQGEADAAWIRYKARHGALLGGYAPNVVQADLGEKGVWYRLRIAGFSSKDAANALCGRLKEDGGACFLGR